jgi:parvulin-like peptidyl-prolyl isomerase
MKMTDKLDLSLPERNAPGSPPLPKTMIIINLLILVMVGAVLAVVVLKNTRSENKQEGAALSGEVRKQLALKLEKQEMNVLAATAWQDYLSVGRPKADEAAKIWYRIGTLYQADRQYGKALAAYYRSEGFARIPELSPEISRRVQESLESLGEFAALRDELAERVGVTNAKPGSPPASDRSAIVAEIGPEKITLSDLDHRIEKAISRQLAMMSPDMPEDILNQQKESLLKPFSTTEQRERFLTQYLAEEILYREARASKLSDDPDVQAEIKEQTRAILAQREIDQAYEKNIKITDGDLKTYYDAHKEDYLIPERIKMSRILVKDEAAARHVRFEILQGKGFSQVAKAESFEAASAANGGKIDMWIEKREKTIIPGIGDDQNAVDLIFQTDAGKLVDENITAKDGIYIIRVDEKEQQHQKSFDEAKNDVYRTLSSQKKQEVRENLIKSLQDKYDVVVHTSALGDGSGHDVQKRASTGTLKTQ